MKALEAGRKAGVCLHLASLPGCFGIGEIGDSALEFIDSMSRMNLAVWQFLPTGPTAFGDSPYQPLSSFAGNELLIDMAGLIRLGLISANEAESLIKLPQHYVDYGDLIPRKNALLQRAAERFASQAGAQLKQDFERFREEHEGQWLHDYALFRVLKARHHELAWPRWDPPYVRREQQAMRTLEKREARAIESVKLVQFLFDHQWRQLRAYATGKGVSLFGDMPIYIALDSADAWAQPELLRMDASGRPEKVAGVPPDYFSEDGQLWGNPLYDWEYHASTGYRWWIDRLEHSTRQVDMIRIDHFRGFESYWAIPYGAQTAREGRWEPGPGDALFNALAASLGKLPIVAEDLGVITTEVEALRDRHRIPGMRVLQFDVMDSHFSVSDIREDCVCYTGTHDNDTTMGWFAGGPQDTRSEAEILRTREAALAITGGSADTIHRDMIRLAYSSAARIAIAPMQDYLGLGSEARLNTPGTSGNNWRWRLCAGQLTPAISNWVAGLVVEHGRGAAQDLPPGRATVL